MTETADLRISQVHVSYGSIRAVRGVSLAVRAGEVHVVLGANGAGKSSLMRSVAGVVKPQSGSITCNGEDITSSPPRSRVRRGITLVPEGRDLFPNMSVRENLMMGAYARPGRRTGVDSWLETVLEGNPRVKDRLEQMAGTLSGGEQQMVAIARGLMSKPRFLLLDEPTLGLAPIVVRDVLERISLLRDLGIGIILVEQTAAAVDLADRVTILRLGQTEWAGSPEELATVGSLRELYLGGG